MKIQAIITAACPEPLMPLLKRIEASAIGSRLAKGAFWSLAGAGLSRGLALLASILVARMLGKTTFGQLGMIQSTVGMFGVLAGFGLGLTATKHVAQFRRSDPMRAGRIIALSSMVALVTGGLMAVALFILSPWLAEHTLGQPNLSPLLRISAVMLFFSALNGSQTGSLSGFEAFKSIARVNLQAGLLAFPMLLCGAYFAGLAGAVWAMAINLAVNWLLNHLALRKESARCGVPLAFTSCTRELPILWRFSIPAVLSGALVGPVNWACCAMLVNQRGGYGELGVYNAILCVKQVPEMLLAMLMAPLLPMLSESFSRRDSQSYNKTLRYAFVLSVCVVVPISLIQAAVPALTLLPYGQGFQGHAGTVQWLMLHAVLVGLFQPFGSMLASMNRMWLGLAYNLSWGAAFAGLTFLLAPRYGGAGLAAAMAIATAATSLPCVLYLYLREKTFVWQIPGRPIVAAVLLSFLLCMAAGIYLAPLPAASIGAMAAIGLLVLSARLARPGSPSHI